MLIQMMTYCCQNDVSLRGMTIEEKDIGEWNDDCSLNKFNCPKSEFEKYFK